MCSLDHRNVVGAVANRKQRSLGTFLDKFDDKSLLQWGHSALRVSWNFIGNQLPYNRRLLCK